MPRKRRNPRSTSVRPPNSPEETATSRIPSPSDLFARQLSPRTTSASTHYPTYTLALPLDWTDADCLMLSCHMFLNFFNNFEDSLEWWGNIVPFFPEKTLQELRLFNGLFAKSYNELAVDRGWNPDNLITPTDEEIESGLPSKEECKDLLQLVEQNPDTLTSIGGWEELATHFSGKNASDIGRNISTLHYFAACMGMKNATALSGCLRSLRQPSRRG